MLYPNFPDKTTTPDVIDRLKAANKELALLKDENKELKEMIEKLGSNQPLNELLEKFQIAYTKGGSFADATRRLIHEMHPEVLCIDASDKRLKDMALDLWRDEILTQSLYNSRDTSIWDNANRTPPVPFNKSMMFYLKDGRRTRINFENGNY